MGLKKEETQAKTGAVSTLNCHIPTNDPRFKRYEELVDSMQVPVIEQLVLARLEELKFIARDEIKEFKRQEKTGRKYVNG